jgi:hypothetical protein
MAKIDFSTLGKKFRIAEKELTKGIIKWKHKREERPLPDEETLETASDEIVNQAHTVVKKQGESLFEGLKSAKDAFIKAYRDDDKK